MKTLMLTVLMGVSSLIFADPYYQNYNNQNKNRNYSANRANQSYISNNPQSQAMQGSDHASNNLDKEIHRQIRDALSAGWFSKGYENVSIDVDDGIVTLRGTVESQDDKAKIEDKLNDISGIRRLNNQILVAGKKSSSNGYLYQNNQNNNNNNQMQNQQNSNQNWFKSNHKSDQSLNETHEKTDSWMTRESSEESKHPQDYAASDADRQLNQKIRDKLKGGWFSAGYENVILKTSNGVVTVKGTVEKAEDIQKITDDIKNVQGVKSVNNLITVKMK